MPRVLAEFSSLGHWPRLSPMELADYRVANPRQMIIVIAPGCLERAFHTQQRGGSKKGGISFRLTNNFS